MTNLPALLARVEKANGPDRELDARLWAEFDDRNIKEVAIVGITSIGRELIAKSRRKPHDECVIGGWWGDGSFYTINGDIMPKFTATIDAALGLVELCLPGWGIEITAGMGDGISVTVGHVGPNKLYDQPEGWGDGPTIPIAVLRALLAALIAKEGKR